MGPMGNRQVAWDAWACALGVLLLGWAVFAHGDGRPELLRQRAEARANSALAQAGYGWAHLRIDDAAAALTGAAPDERSRAALREDAPRLLDPYMGVPGVFQRIDDRLALNESLPPRPPAPPAEPEIDLLSLLPAPGAGLPTASTASAARGSAGTALTTASRPAGPSQTACERAFQSVQSARPIRFKPASAQLDSSAMPLIQQLAALALRCNQWRVVVEGHADASGDKQQNDRLSQRRAASVAAAMMLEGVPLERLSSVGMGASSPLTAAQDEQASAQNRRIEFRIIALARP